MSINREDSNKIGYQGILGYSKERKYRTEEPERKTDKGFIPVGEDRDVDSLRNKFKDLNKKAQKLDNVIDETSMALSIPIDKEKQPDISLAVSNMDPSSAGEYLSYTLYRDMLNQREAGDKNITLDWLMQNRTDDAVANSQLLHNKQIEGNKSYKDLPLTSAQPTSEGATVIEDNFELNDIAGWSEHEQIVNQVMSWANNFITGNSNPKFIPWSFKADKIGRASCRERV